MPAMPKIDLSSAPKNKKIVFETSDNEDTGADDGTPAVKEVIKSKNKKRFDKVETSSVKSGQVLPKKIKFNDDGEIESTHQENPSNEAEDEDDYFTKREKQRVEMLNQKESDNDSEKKWYHVHPQFPSTEDVLEMKESEQMELYNLCKSSFEGEKSAFNKRNPSDYRWLQTALHKGTARDRANAGALLVASNPLGNLEALTTLIGFTKMSNKSSTEVISIITDLWKEVLLPSHRKLLSLQLRGADWKQVRHNNSLSRDQQKRIYAYWYFENELKDQYFEFLKNLQQAIQTGQESNKNIAIVAAAQLLVFAPEKEQLLLTMLVNKLGDPMPKVASKALHHLTEVANRHPNMCSVIVTEAEKLLFRNNISDRAQHFALCLLSSIAPSGRPEVCTKLVNICFALFKVLVQRGAVNSRIMQAILRCLQKAILDAAPAKGSTEILTKEMQDTVYRLVHLADIRISIQTLGLLLQLITIKTEKNDRFYNALYVKLTDMELTSMGTKTAAQLLHIVHRAIHIDSNIPRNQAFIKRLLQLALYAPPNIASGCLIVLNKLLRSRKELTSTFGDVVNGTSDLSTVENLPKISADDEALSRFDSDGEEKYEDVKDDDKGSNSNKEGADEKENEDSKEDKKVQASWHHVKVIKDEATAPAKTQQISASKYDPYNRVPAFAGAEFSLRNELLLLKEHFHPTVQVFADSILNNKRIAYYGDPLRDFGLPHFLERFAFKNPKKLETTNAEAEIKPHKRYIPYGTRGRPVKSLTKDNCTEDEMFILNFLEQKRQKSILAKKKKTRDDDDDEDQMDTEGVEDAVEDVDDAEFEDYLDGFFGKKSKDDEDEEEVDFLKEFGGELKSEQKKNKKSKKKSLTKGGKNDDDEDLEDIDADWGDDDDLDVDGDEKTTFEADGSDISDDEEGSIDFDQNDDEDDEDLSDASISMDDGGDNTDDSEEPDDIDDESDDDIQSSKSKKPNKKAALGMDGKSFAKKLKHSDMSSLFAAADDFAELLEETGKTKGQGTSNAIFNKDKSSEKQLKWEQKRHSNAKEYVSKKHHGSFKSGKKSFGAKAQNKSGKKFNSKKRKH